MPPTAKHYATRTLQTMAIVSERVAEDRFVAILRDNSKYGKMLSLWPAISAMTPRFKGYYKRNI